MPHKFTTIDDQRLAGVWSTCNRRTYCAWEFDSSTGTLRSRRGMTVHAAKLESETRSLEELREELPKLALEIVRGKAPAH